MIVEGALGMAGTGIGISGHNGMKRRKRRHLRTETSRVLSQLTRQVNNAGRRRQGIRLVMAANPTADCRTFANADDRVISGNNRAAERYSQPCSAWLASQSGARCGVSSELIDESVRRFLVFNHVQVIG